MNRTSLYQHYKDINHDHNFQMFRILYVFIKTRIHYASTSANKFIHSTKYLYISIHDNHGLMMMYDIHMHLDSFNTITNDSLEYIKAIFNTNTQKKIHIVCVYEVYSCSIFTFLNNLQIIIPHFFKHCPIIILRDFNVDILLKNHAIIYIYIYIRFHA